PRPRRFAANSSPKKLIPVRLPPGRARLATRPSVTGSSAARKTIGIVVVAAFAASAPRVVMATSTPDDGSNRVTMPADDRTAPPPSGTRSPRSRPQRSPRPSGPDEIHAAGPSKRQAMRHGEIRLPASRTAFRAPSPQGPLAHAGTRGIPSDGRCRAGPLICLGRAGDACVVGALERVGDTLYGARVYGKLGRRLAHAHAARQSCSDSLSQLVRDRRPAKSFTFTLGPL